jgi:hypothetical protein
VRGATSNAHIIYAKQVALIAQGACSRAGAPVFDPEGSLGWRDIPLDGLNCYLRCVEAVLRAEGHDSTGLVRVMGGPVDLLRRSRIGSQFAGRHVAWRFDDGTPAHFSGLLAAVRAGQPVIVVPDRYHWPGDELEQRDHHFDHAVLVIGAGSGEITFLDTDAPAEADWRRSLPIDERLRSACARWGTLEHDGPPPGPELDVARLARESLELLALDVPALRGFAAELRLNGLDSVSGRALHVAVLGDFQPVLFLFAAALELSSDPAAARLLEPARRAAAKAKILGLVLLGLHRDGSAAAYDLCIGAFDALVVALDVLGEALAHAVGSQPPISAAGDSGPVTERLMGLITFCFDEQRTALWEG